MEDIEVEFNWTAEDLIAGRHWHWRNTCRPSLRVAADLGVALLIATLIFVLLDQGLSVIQIAVFVACSISTF